MLTLSNNFIATFVLPFCVGLVSFVLPTYVLEYVAQQPWAKQYLITYKKGEDRWNDKDLHSHDDENTSFLGTLTASILTTSILYAAQLDSLQYGELFQPITFQLWIFQYMLMFYVTDFCFYFVHYLAHKYDFLWKVHSVHHRVHTPRSSQWAFGTFWSQLSNLLPFLVAQQLIQPHAMAFYASFAVYAFSFGPYAHSGMDMPWLDVILGYGWMPFRATPNLHDTHHRKSGRRATNLGGTMWLWDYCFGTLETDRV